MDTVETVTTGLVDAIESYDDFNGLVQAQDNHRIVLFSNDTHQTFLVTVAQVGS